MEKVRAVCGKRKRKRNSNRQGANKTDVPEMAPLVAELPMLYDPELDYIECARL